MNKPQYIIIHCSDSHYGNVQLITEWHIARDYKTIGYHYVITNCYPTRDLYEKYIPCPASDGSVAHGRELSEEGAHAYGYNAKSIGICLIGVGTFTSKQLKSLKILVQHLQYKYGYKLKVLGHKETNKGKAQGKTCPNLHMNWLRDYLEE